MFTYNPNEPPTYGGVLILTMAFKICKILTPICSSPDEVKRASGHVLWFFGDLAYYCNLSGLCMYLFICACLKNCFLCGLINLPYC